MFSLSGLELVRAYMRGLIARTPLFRLLGPRITQASSGTAVVHQTMSPWFEVNGEYVDLLPTAEYALYIAAVTGAPPGTSLRTTNASLRYLRPCTVEDEMVIARGRVLHAGSSFSTVEALIEDSLGRAVAHAMGAVTVQTIDPPPPPLTRQLQPVEEPTYTTPDPVHRPLTGDTAPDADKPTMPPFGRFLGAQLLELDEGKARLAMPNSEWFCRFEREVPLGIVGMLGNLAITYAVPTVTPADQRFVILNTTTTVLAPVVADGRMLHASAAVRHTADVMLPEAEISDETGRTVAVVQSACLLRPREGHKAARTSERLLMTVVFTDVVGSTAHAQQLGDARWGELLDEHNALFRRELQRHGGREIKSTGDGFLATFDSPSRAVRCALAVRDGVRKLGLEIRAGVHSGECELVGGDIAGLAVHVSSRIESMAQAGEVLVSGTTRDLIAGSGFRFIDKGQHGLKGVDGTYGLFSAEQ